MSIRTRARQPRGAPVGGQFATTARAGALDELLVSGRDGKPFSVVTTYRVQIPA